MITFNHLGVIADDEELRKCDKMHDIGDPDGCACTITIKQLLRMPVSRRYNILVLPPFVLPLETVTLLQQLEHFEEYFDL